MKISKLACAVVVLGTLSGLARAGCGAEGLDQQWVKSVKAGDLDGLTALYAPDAVGWFPGQPEARGQASIRATYAGLMKDSVVVDAAISDAHYLTTGGHCFAWGMFTLTLKPKAGGEPQVMQGRYTEEAERRRGKWLLLVDHASADLPAPSKP